MTQIPTRYRVYFTPRNGRTSYGDEVEVTEKVLFDGLPSIKRSIDSTDFDFGVYKYDDINLKCENVDGEFNDEMDGRSMFPFGRDKCKVRVLFTNADGDTIVFRGFINEEATREDSDEGYSSISFRVLSRDSVLRTVKVAGGVVNAGQLASAALFSALNQPDITDFLNVDVADINVDNDLVLDSDEGLTDVPAKDCVNKLLLATNSVMLINSDGDVIIKSREERTEIDVLNLYGPFDLKGRSNIIKVSNYNSGRHRNFTSVRVNDTEESDTSFVMDYGYRQKSISLPFITSSDKESAVAARLVREFKLPKIELEVEIPVFIARAYDLLDRVSINYPLRIQPVDGTFLPIIGVTEIGDAMMPLPQTFGSLVITPETAFKIIEIVENPKDFTMKLKLRQVGVSTSDGYFNVPTSCIIGFARIGEGLICAGGSACDQFEDATIGAAKIGCTLVG